MILNIIYSINLNQIVKLKLRKLIRCVLYAICFHCGFFFLVRFISNYRGKRVTILTFHRIGNSNNVKITHSLPTSFISKNNFEAIIKFLLKYYTVISLSEYLNQFTKHQQPPKNSVIITFDDGYKDIHDNGFPILKKYKIPVTIFLTSSYMNSKKVFWWDKLFALCKNGVPDSSFKQFPNEIYPPEIQNRLLSVFALNKERRDPFLITLITELQNYDYSLIKLIVQDLQKRLGVDLKTVPNKNKMLAWNNIRELQSIGVTFGSHTRTHLFLNHHLPKDIIVDETLNSKIELEQKLNHEITAFAYPGGKVSPKIKEIVKTYGYKVACTQVPGINSIKEDIYAL